VRFNAAKLLSLVLVQRVVECAGIDNEIFAAEKKFKRERVVVSVSAIALHTDVAEIEKQVRVVVAQ